MIDSESPTQLADNRPQFDSALRIALPFNVPQRIPKKSKDQLIRINAFAPDAQATNRNKMEALTNSALASKCSVIQNDNLEDATRFTKSINHSFSKESDADIKTTIRDLTLLAFSSKRAGKRDIEATAYLSIGVIQDNQENFYEALEYYKQYLEICEETNDTVGCALACNCLGIPTVDLLICYFDVMNNVGVNYMLMVCPPTDAGLLQSGIKLTGTSVEDLNHAISYHFRHLEIGPDDGGRFVADSNLGLCFGMIGDIVQSAKHQQDALRTTIKMQTLYGQSIAVGNLGMLAVMKNDIPTARTCFEQHLQLVQTLSDAEAEVCAWKALAHVCSVESKHGEALEYLEQARNIAHKNHFTNELRTIHCLIGVARGMLDFNSYSDMIIDFVNNQEVSAIAHKS